MVLGEIGTRHPASAARWGKSTIPDPAWKLYDYFPERQRSDTDSEGGTRPTFLADQILDLFDHHEVAGSVMLRSISSFGPVGLLRSDESLTLSEDPPQVIYAVDEESKITPLVDDVVAMTGRGLLTMERAQLVRGGAAPDLASAGESDAIKLSVYVGRTGTRRTRPGVPRHLRCALRPPFAVTSALLGVDGTAHGVRYRAEFFSRNVNIPMIVVADGQPHNKYQGAVDEIDAAGTEPFADHRSE